MSERSKALSEISRCLGFCSSTAVVEALQSLKTKLESEGVHHDGRDRHADSAVTPVAVMPAASAEPVATPAQSSSAIPVAKQPKASARFVDMTKNGFLWDQSDNFVKVYV